MKPRILVTAANGHTGYPAAKELLKLGFPVRALVRNKQAETALELKKLGAEIFVGDIENINDTRKALMGIERAYFVPTYPNVLFQGETFATAAEEFGTKHVVILTQWLSSNMHPSIYTKEHWLVDQTFKRLPHTDVTFLNPGLFGFIYFMTPEPLTQFGILADFGNNAPPSNEDIGLVAAHVLKAPGHHKDRTYRVTGRELLTPGQMASKIGNVLNKKVKAVRLGEKMIFKILRASGYSQMDTSQVKYYIQEGYKNTWEVNAPTNVVQEIVGKEADDFETIAQNYLKQYPIAQPTWANKFRAIGFMLKAILTPAWNMVKFERERGLPNLSGMIFSNQSNEWLATHRNQNINPQEFKNHANISN